MGPLPLSSSALTMPEPTVPAPPRANTTLSEFAMLAAAAQTCWRMEDNNDGMKLRTCAEHLRGAAGFKLNPGAAVPPFYRCH